MSDRPPSSSATWTWPAGAVAFILPFGVGLAIYGQGFDLNADGLWLLGVRTWLRSGALYPHLAVDAAPGRFAFVLPLYLLWGQSGVALAAAKALATGLCSGAGFVLARRAGAGSRAWIVPAATLALGPMDPAVAMLALTVCAADGRSPGMALVAMALASATFGPAVALAAIAVVLATRGPSIRQRLLWAMMAAGAWVASAWIAAGGQASWAGSALASSVGRIGDAVTGGFGPSWISATRSGLSRPFADVATGEELSPLFAGHAAWRVVAAWTWSILPLAALGAALKRRLWREARPSLVALVIAVVALAFSSSAREWAWLATLWIGVALLRSIRPARWSRTATAALAVLALGPDLVEATWLSTHAGRPTLKIWDRPRARMQMSADLIDHWESVFAAVREPAGTTSLLVWPHRPGLYVIFDLDLPTRQATLVRGNRVDPAAVLDELESSRPSSVILAIGDTRATSRLRQNWPSLWRYLRENHKVVGNVASGPDPARVLERIEGGMAAIHRLPLPEQLADVEIPVSNEAGPAMRPGLSVGQTVQVGPSDLRGISVRWRTAGRPIETLARLRVWQRRGDEYDALLEFLEVNLVIPEDGYRSFLRFDEPIADTAGKDLAITLELREDTGDEIRLLWHREDGRREDDDIYPQGTAVVNRKPVPADLYFFSY